ncbi:MAG: hypothetical protein HZB54_06325 [Deltaproteobacteria bacterium]|nr:hypothetical protein [Deltaproteobacteria bacterium]
MTLCIEENNMNRKQKILLASLIAGHFVILILGVFYRFVDGDEGGYLVVSKEVINGRIPILDINAHNQPLLYYFYGLWMKIFGFTIPAARSLSAATVFIVGLLIFYWVYKFSKKYWAAVISYILFIINLTFYKVNISVKPFPLSNFFIFASFVILTSRYLSGRLTENATLFFSGLLLGMAMGIRLIFILPVMFVIWLIVVMYRENLTVNEIAKKAAIFCIGVIIPLLPSIWIFIKEPLRAYAIWGGAYAQVYFGKGNNPDFAADVLKDMKHDMMIKGLIDVVKVPDTVFLLLLVLISTVLLIRKWRQGMDKIEFNIYLLIWMIFGGIIWIYSNMYANYLGYVNQLTLFAVLLSLPVVEKITNAAAPKKLIVYVSIFLATIIGLSYLHFQKRLKTSIFYMFNSKEQIITPEFVNDISENVIKKLTKEGDVVLDTWGVFVFTSNRRPLNGYEYPTDQALFWKLMPNRENARKYLYISETELLMMLEKKEIPLLVLGDPKALNQLVLDERLAKSDDIDIVLNHANRYYYLYRKYFVKPTNAWLLIYLPEKPL